MEDKGTRAGPEISRDSVGLEMMEALGNEETFRPTCIVNVL